MMLKTYHTTYCYTYDMLYHKYRRKAVGKTRNTSKIKSQKIRKYENNKYYAFSFVLSVETLALLLVLVGRSTYYK